MIFDGVVQDLRFTFRNFQKSPGFTFTAGSMLALGIGINVLVFTVINAALFKGFPLVHDNSRIVYITTGRNCCVSYPDFEDWRAQAKSFEGMALVHGMQKSFSEDGSTPETYIATEVTADTFKIAGQKPVLGRDFTQSDETPGAPTVAILRYSFWDRHYGKNPLVIGRKVRINGEPATIIGVMPRGFSFPQNQEFWVPLVPTTDLRRRENRDTWFAFGRLRKDATIAGARAEMETIGRRLAIAYPATNQGLMMLPHVRNFREFFIGENSTVIYESMLVAVAFVLLIACANLANLLLARGIARSHEIAVRAALGASRWRIIRQLLIENFMLSAAGGLAGWWIASWGVRIYALVVTGAAVADSIGGNWFDNVLDYSMDGKVFAYLVMISVATGLLFGLAPASRLSKFGASAALNGGRTFTAGKRGRRLSDLLVIGEMALALVLLAGAGVMIRSFLNVYRADIGVRTQNLVSALLALPKERYPLPQAQATFFDKLTDDLKTVPGIESVAISNSLPTAGSRHLPYELERSAPVDASRRPVISVLTVGPDYFKTVQADLLSGREFNDHDGVTDFPVAIINERFAVQGWPGADAIGKRIRLFEGNSPEVWLTVVGIAPNIVQNDATRQEIDPVIYVPYHRAPVANMWVIARTRVPPATLVGVFRQKISRIDRELPTALGPFPVADYLAWNYQYRGISGVLFLGFAAIALLIASIGLYAVVANSVSQRTREIGIRMAIGATRRDILELVLVQGLFPLAFGLAAGLGLSVAVNRIIRAQLVHVSPTDTMTFLIATAALTLAAAFGCWIPARRATRVDPVVALRNE